MIQFGRVAQVVLATPQERWALTLRTSFNIEKEMTAQGTSKAEIKIYNLSARHIAMAEAAGRKLQIFLVAGYSFLGQTNASQLFAGPVNYMTNDRTGPELVTSFEMLPGSLPMNNIFVSLSGAQNDYQVYQAVLNACQNYGLNQHYISPAVMAKLQGGTYQNGLSECGTAAKLLDLICLRHGLRWNPDNNNLSLFAANEYEGQASVVLSGPTGQYPNGTGLIGIPSKMLDMNYKIKALLNPDIAPGRQVVVTSPIAGLSNQAFKVWKSTYVGDTLKGEWSVESECSPLGKSPSLLVQSGS